jgi:hypothetical protein
VATATEGQVATARTGANQHYSNTLQCFHAVTCKLSTACGKAAITQGRLAARVTAAVAKQDSTYLKLQGLKTRLAACSAHHSSSLCASPACLPACLSVWQTMRCQQGSPTCVHQTKNQAAAQTHPHLTPQHKHTSAFTSTHCMPPLHRCVKPGATVGVSPPMRFRSCWLPWQIQQAYTQQTHSSRRPHGACGAPPAPYQFCYQHRTIQDVHKRVQVPI